MKYLLLGLLAYIGWRWYFAQRQQDEPAAPAPAPAGDSAERIVSCAECGIHVPQSEAVSGPDSLSFCSDEHRLRHSRQQSS